MIADARLGGGVLMVHIKLALPPDETRVPKDDNVDHWSEPLKETIVGANIRRVQFW